MECKLEGGSINILIGEGSIFCKIKEIWKIGKNKNCFLFSVLELILILNEWIVLKMLVYL